MKIVNRSHKALAVLALFAAVNAPIALSQTTPSEAHALHAFEAAKKAGEPELYAFLKTFPKGGDLHLHLSGAIYAETFIREAAADGLCVDTTSMAFVAPKPAKGEPACPPKAVSVQSALTGDQALYNKMVNAMSVRSFVATNGYTGHDQFFDTFDRWGALGDSHKAEWVDEVATRAAENNTQYVEIMDLPNVGGALGLATKLSWPNPATPAEKRAAFEAMRAKLLASGFDAQVAIAKQGIETENKGRLELEHCSSSTPAAGCTVKLRYIIGVLRDFTPEQLFAQFMQGFALAAEDPLVVAINPLRAEDWHGSLERYTLGMEMIDYLHALYPTVHLTLHAGELSPGLVPPEDLSSHIRQAIEIGHAERIGHGIDVLYEDRSDELLKEMADKHIMVEINLTSNDQLNGIAGSRHPLAAYRAAHVPWALSTDDEGVSRSDLTHEYVRGVMEQGLSYADLKQSARTALEHSFLAGDSLWAKPDIFTGKNGGCPAVPTRHLKLGSECAAFLARSERATQQWELEMDFLNFEAAVH